MSDDYTFRGALSRAGRDHVLATLPAMDASGLTWLTPHIEGMISGDPWQEGLIALEIVQAWEAGRVEDSGNRLA